MIFVAAEGQKRETFTRLKAFTRSSGLFNGINTRDRCGSVGYRYYWIIAGAVAKNSQGRSGTCFDVDVQQTFDQWHLQPTRTETCRHSKAPPFFKNIRVDILILEVS